MSSREMKPIAKAKRLVDSLSQNERLELWRYLADALGEAAALEWEDRFLATDAGVRSDVEAALAEHARGKYVTADQLRKKARKRGDV